jgi:hypothetical protein
VVAVQTWPLHEHLRITKKTAKSAFIRSGLVRAASVVFRKEGVLTDFNANRIFYYKIAN